MTVYGDNLKKLRKQKDVSQEELAKFSGVTKSTISKYERGEIDPTIDVANKIASFFGTTIEFMATISIENDEIINQRNAKAIYGLPKEYMNAIKLAHSHNIEPSKLIELIEFSIKFGK